mmetsp:Transcript_112500/g.195209  ORF Transcript_112500/g.195209 Transcript_112500/m.195209 type:complete len:886 (-) Transcript_112500:92-2749(-)
MATEGDQALDLLVPHRGSANAGSRKRLSLLSTPSTASDVSDASNEREPPHWIKTEQADYVFTCIILANAVFMGVDIDVSLQNGGDSGPILFVLQLIFYLIFLVEIVVRIYIDGRVFFRWSNWLGLLDLSLVVAGTLDYLVAAISGVGFGGLVNLIRFCRLLRIVRIVRVLHLCPELWLLVHSLASSTRFIAWAFMLLMVLLYVCCLICTMELADRSEELKEYFGSIDRSLFTHFMVLTLEGYPDVAEAAGKVSWIWYIYFVIFIVMSSILVINLVTGIIVEHVCSQSKSLNNDNDDPYASASFDLYHFRELFVDLYQAAGFAPEEEIGFEEFRRIFRSEAIRDGMNALEICLSVDESELFKILDHKGRGKFTVEEMIAGLLRLQGSKRFLQSVFSQGDVVSSSLKIKEKFASSEREVSKYSESICAALESKLSQHVSDLWRAADSLPTPHASSLCKQPVLDQLPHLLDTLEASSAEAGEVLARMKEELQASRERVRHLEGKVCKRVSSVQTEHPMISVSDEWNHDREMVVNQVLILAEGAGAPANLDFSKGIERLLDEEEAKRKSAKKVPMAEDADLKVTVTIVGAKDLPGKTGKYDFCCTCAIPGKPWSQFLTRVAHDTSHPSWDETHELTDYQFGDPIEFVVLDMSKTPRMNEDASVAAGKLLGEQFFPHGFDGDLQLTEPSPKSSNLQSSLQVKVHVQGSLKQVLDSSAFDLNSMSSVSRDLVSSARGSSFWPRSPPLTPMHIDRHNADLEKFRRHPCSSGKEAALDAMRTPSSSGDEEPLGSWRQKAEHRRRSSSASPSLGSTFRSQSLLQATPSSARSTPNKLFPRRISLSGRWDNSASSDRGRYVSPISQPSRILTRSRPKPLVQLQSPEAPSARSASP